MNEKEIETLCSLLERFTGKPVQLDYIIDVDGCGAQISFPIELEGENGQTIIGQRCWMDEKTCPRICMWEVNESLLDNCVADFNAKIEIRS